MLVIFIDSQLQHIFALLETETTVDLVLDREAMAVPAESASDVVAFHGLESSNDVLDCTGEDVAVVRESSGERRPVVEDVLGHVFCELELCLERLDFIPKIEGLLLVFWEGEVFPFTYFLHRKC